MVGSSTTASYVGRVKKRGFPLFKIAKWTQKNNQKTQKNNTK